MTSIPTSPYELAELLAENYPSDFLVYYAYRIIKRERAKISAGNGFYDWSLSNLSIAVAYVDLEEAAELFCRNKIKRKEFIAAIYIYFDVVYQETEKAWRERWFGTTEPDRPQRCEALWIGQRELEFINNRFQSWVRDERFGVLELDLDNQIPQEDLSHINVDNVMTKDYVITWGKYKAQRYTIGGLIDRDPKWLHWAVTQTQRLKVSDEIMTEILKAQSEL